MTDTGPLFVSSGDLIADRRYKWALDHVAQGDLSGAADILAQTVELAPRFATAWFALGAIRDQLGDRALPLRLRPLLRPGWGPGRGGRGVPAECRLAGRRRSLARHDRASVDQR